MSAHRVLKRVRYLAQINILRKLTRTEQLELYCFIGIHGSYQRPYWKVVHYKTPYISRNPINRHSSSRTERAMFYRIPLEPRKVEIEKPTMRLREPSFKRIRRLHGSRRKNRSILRSLLVTIERHLPD